MDEIRAKEMEKKLKGKKIGKYRLIERIGNGKSALVFKGSYADGIVAVKIFDPELVQNQKRENQLQRINRELMLRNKEHDNLIRIIDGGDCKKTGYLYIVMEYLNYPSLRNVISLIPRENIKQIISQIASAAYFLETLDLCHRDIKPDNIIISPDYQKAILLDLGVLRPIGDSDLTDEEAQQFIGTLRYSSPEFLSREECDDTEGWRAVTFYQLGGVLHDLIMKKPLFDEYSQPFSKLVEAVKNVEPEIYADDVTPDLIHLAKTCLIKDPKVRIDLVNWQSFSFDREHQPVEEAIDRIHQRATAAKSERPEVAGDADKRQCDRLKRKILDRVDGIIRTICSKSNGFPPIKIERFNGNTHYDSRLVISFEPSSTHKLSIGFYITINITIVNATSEAIIMTYISSVGDYKNDIIPPEDNSLFKGVFFEDIIKEKLLVLFNLALDKAQQLKTEIEAKLLLTGPIG